MKYLLSTAILFAAMGCLANAQEAPYDVFPDAEPPYYRVRYDVKDTDHLIFPVSYTIWIPKEVKTLRGVIVHQHGCGEGSCKSGLTGAFDLHWQALARKHDCALLGPSYEQPQDADCQMWCDPRNGSDQAFQQALHDLAKQSGHPELANVPWALWGHSGGGHWCGGMVMLHPERVVAAWLRSGVPLLRPNPERPKIKTHSLPAAALSVPLMCNPGTKEGVTVKDGRFAGVWPANELFFNSVRSKGGLIGVAIDPLTAHECGNQRYLAIRWLDSCLGYRLPKIKDSQRTDPEDRQPLQPMPKTGHWLAALLGDVAKPTDQFDSDPSKAIWLPDAATAKLWMQYVKDTNVTDLTPPPAPTTLQLSSNRLSWQANADLESGLAHFIVQRDGKFFAKVPEQNNNRFGRDIFQNLQYSDTPIQPLMKMQFEIADSSPNDGHRYRIIAVNTVGLQSEPSTEIQSVDR